MSVPLSNLVPSVLAQINPLGGPVVIDGDADEDAIVAALADAFWTAKAIGGWFAGYRTDVDGVSIVNVSGGPELPREEQQIIVLMLVLTAWEAKLVGLTTRKKAKAGTAEVEKEQSATLLNNLLNGKRKVLADLVAEVKLAGRDSSIGVFDQAAHAAACRDSFVR